MSEWLHGFLIGWAIAMTISSLAMRIIRSVK